MRLFHIVLLLLSLHNTSPMGGPWAYKASVMREEKSVERKIQEKSDQRLNSFIDKRAICVEGFTYISLFRWETNMNVIEKSVETMRKRGWKMRLLDVIAKGKFDSVRKDTGAILCNACTIDSSELVAKIACFRTMVYDLSVHDYLLYHGDGGYWNPVFNKNITIIEVSM